MTIPDAIAKLPTDERGYPVPWVSMWMPDDDDDPTGHTRWDEVHGSVVDCSCVIGEGTARLGRICPSRQLRGTLERICGTCGTHIDGWCCWPVDNVGGKITEAPNHPECMAYSLSTCPFLKGAVKRFDSFRIMVARDYRYTWGRAIVHPDHGDVIGEFPFDHPPAVLRALGTLLLTFVDTRCGELVTVEELWSHPVMVDVSRPD